jgi:hypothetical protein
VGQSDVTPIGFDLLISAVLALAVGVARNRPRSVRVAAGIVIAFLAWAASYPLVILGVRLGGDTALAEDYVNGFSVVHATIEIAIALAWTCFWFALGDVGARVARRFTGRTR